jgi:DNA-binding NarL/FixJ family response regulator
MLGALCDVCNGGAALDSRLAKPLFEGLAALSPSPIPVDATELDARVLSLLSQREREVLQALAQGYRNKQIGAALGVSVGTVKTHLRHIFRKLQVVDRTGAVLKALDVSLRRAA